MSIPIEAPPERPGHVGHTPQPLHKLGMRLGRLYDAGGIFGSGVVRALTGAVQPAGVLPVAVSPEYAMQPFGIPGRRDARAKPPTPEQRAQSTAHTVLALEEASLNYGRAGGRQSAPEALRRALEDMRTWKAPR